MTQTQLQQNIESLVTNKLGYEAIGRINHSSMMPEPIENSKPINYSKLELKEHLAKMNYRVDPTAKNLKRIYSSFISKGVKYHPNDYGTYLQKIIGYMMR